MIKVPYLHAAVHHAGSSTEVHTHFQTSDKVCNFVLYQSFPVRMHFCLYHYTKITGVRAYVTEAI